MIGKVKGGDRLVLTASGYRVPKGTVLYANTSIPVSSDGSIYAAERPGEEYYNVRTLSFKASDLEPYKEATMFRVGDRVRAVNAKYGWGHVEPDSKGVVTDILFDGECNVDFMEQKGWHAGPNDLELIEDIKETKGEDTMTSEETKRPEFIIITRNTEMFKKGGVFKKDGASYDQVVDAYQVRQFAGRTTLSEEQVDVLLQKKVAVEAVKFNPEFVTLEQNEVLGKALDNMKKKPAAKKKTVASKKA